MTISNIVAEEGMEISAMIWSHILYQTVLLINQKKTFSAHTYFKLQFFFTNIAEKPWEGVK